MSIGRGFYSTPRSDAFDSPPAGRIPGGTESMRRMSRRPCSEAPGDSGEDRIAEGDGTAVAP